MVDKSQDIISLINQYTSELESLDQLNITYIMTCIGAIGVIFSMIATILSLNANVWKTPPYRLVAPLFLSIPVIVCIFLCVVTLNCRKVAMYRSYLVYLENSYNQIEGVIPQYYNSKIQQFLSKWWITNPNGSLMNRIVDITVIAIIVLLLVVCFVLAHRTFKKTMAVKGYEKDWTKKFFYIAYFLLIGICILVCVACFYDLILNRITVEKVLQELYNLSGN